VWDNFLSHTIIILMKGVCMYFIIAGVTSKILLFLFIVIFMHFGFNSVMALLGNTKLELPFYLKPLYSPFIKVMNTMNSWTTYKKGEPITYLYFVLSLLVFAIFCTLANYLIFPITSTVVFSYLFISFKMNYGKSETTKEN